MSPRSLALWSLGLVILGSLVAWLGRPVWLDVVGIMLGGIGFVGLLAAFFLAVGQADDRYRSKNPHG